MNDRNDVLATSKITFYYRTECKFDRKRQCVLLGWLTHQNIYTLKSTYSEQYTIHPWKVNYLEVTGG